MNKQYWVNLALSSIAGITAAQADQIADQAGKLEQIWVDAGSPSPMPETMDYGVWHASSMVLGHRCSCFKCCKARSAQS